MSNLRLQTVFLNTFLPVKHLAQPGTFEIKNFKISIFSIIMEPGFCMFVTALRGWGSEMSTGMRDIHHPPHGARSQVSIITNTGSISNIMKFHGGWAPCIRKTWKPICLFSLAQNFLKYGCCYFLTKWLCTICRKVARLNQRRVHETSLKHQILEQIIFQTQS